MKRLLSKLILVLSLFLGSAHFTELYAQFVATNPCNNTSYTTVATWYGSVPQVGGGACGYPGGTYPANYCAIITADYQNGLACGTCLSVQQTSGGAAVTMEIIDKCPSCSTAHQIDLSDGAWNALTGNAAHGTANVKWTVVACPLAMRQLANTNGNIAYYFKDSCSSGWDPIQFRQTNYPVIAVNCVSGCSGSVPQVLFGDNPYWGPLTTAPVVLAVEDANNQWVTTGSISACSGNTARPAGTGATMSAMGDTGVQFTACGGSSSNTNTFTPSPTKTFTPTQTRTFTSTFTKTNTPIPPTNTFTFTRTNTPANTSTFTPTRTFTMTNTFTATPTKTNSPTSTSTFTSTRTNTPMVPTNTFTATFTRTFTSTSTMTNTFTATATRTNSPTSTSTFTSTRTNTPAAPTNTFTATSTRTFTSTSTLTNTPTTTFTSTVTRTFTSTNTSTNTTTPMPPTNTFTPTLTRTFTFTPTSTRTFTPANTATSTFTRTNTNTLTPTRTFTDTPTNFVTFTPTNSPTNTNSSTSTRTPTTTNSFTATFTRTTTYTPVNTFTSTSTATSTFSSTPTRTSTATFTRTITNTATQTLTPTNSSTSTVTSTGTQSPTNTFTSTFTRTNTGTFTNTPSNTATLTRTFTPIFTNTSSNTATSTATATSTSTFSRTPTNSPTNSMTATQTSTGTAPPTNTSTSTITFSSTSAKTSTPSSTATSTAAFTSTATPATVSLSVGTSEPGNSTQVPGSSNIPVLQIHANNPSNAPATLTSLKLTAGGSANDASGISGVSLYLDANNDGILDNGDSLLSTGTYPSDNGVLTLNFTSGIGAFGTANYLVVYNFSGSAPAGTYQANVAGNGDVTGVNGITGQPVVVTGAPLAGAVVTIAQQTATPTSTAIPSATMTHTHTPAATATSTPGVISNPYPNPSEGGPIRVDLNFNGTLRVKFGVFTAAFRKIFENDFTTSDKTLTWDLTDKSGASVASGLYYLRIEVDGPSGPMVKIKKVLVVR